MWVQRAEAYFLYSVQQQVWQWSTIYLQCLSNLSPTLLVALLSHEIVLAEGLHKRYKCFSISFRSPFIPEAITQTTNTTRWLFIFTLLKLQLSLNFFFFFWQFDESFHLPGEGKPRRNALMPIHEHDAPPAFYSLSLWWQQSQNSFLFFSFLFFTPIQKIICITWDKKQCLFT